MFHRTAQAPCRLTARRRLALGGLVMTGALAAGAFASTPAFADDTAPTRVSDIGHLQDALADPSVQRIQLVDFDTDFNPGLLEVTGTKALDLDGVVLRVSNVVVDANTSFSVTDSQYSPDSGSSTGQLQVDPGSGSTGSAPDSGTGVLLQDGSALNVTGAAVWATGVDGGAGIGSEQNARATVAVGPGADVEGQGGTLRDANGNPVGGGAGIGGSDGHDGVTVNVSDGYAWGDGGAGAAGIGGGYGADGGQVHLTGGTMEAGQGDAIDSASTSPASSVGGGEGAVGPTGLGDLRIDRGGDLELYNGTALFIPSGATVENAGTIGMTDYSGGAVRNEITGSGTIHNLGTVKAATRTFSQPPTPAAVDPFIASSVTVTGYNYAVAVDANGGALTGASATAGHLLSASLSDVLGDSYSVASPSATSDFWKWNTSADGSGTDVADAVDGDLAALGTSADGTPVPAPLHARFAAHPVATASALPDGTVGAAYHAALPISGDGLNYSVEYGGSSSSMIPGLPDGLTIDPSTGVISGTPTEAVDRDVVFYVNGPRVGDDFTYHLVVTAPPVVTPAPTTSTPAPAPTASAPAAPSLPAVPNTTVKLGHELHLVVTAKSSVPVTYALASGTLPKGLRLDRATGVIGGSPSESGFFSVVVEATSSAGSASTPVVIVVPEVKDLLATKNAVPAVKAGASTVPLKVGGLEKGEHWTLKVDGKLVDRGTMKKAGTLAVSVHLRKALRDKVHTIVISGSREVADRATRAATTVTITSLAAKKAFSVKSVAGYDGRKYVVIERLAAGERVVVKDGAKTIASGHAMADGSFVFPQAKAGKGTSRLTVHGAAAKRTGKLTVKNPKH